MAWQSRTQTPTLPLVFSSARLFSSRKPVQSEVSWSLISLKPKWAAEACMPRAGVGAGVCVKERWRNGNCLHFCHWPQEADSAHWRNRQTSQRPVRQKGSEWNIEYSWTKSICNGWICTYSLSLTQIGNCNLRGGTVFICFIINRLTTLSIQEFFWSFAYPWA